MPLPSGMLFREIWYCDRWVLFWANYGYNIQIWAKLGAFWRVICRWVGNLAKNWYREVKFSRSGRHIHGYDRVIKMLHQHDSIYDVRYGGNEAKGQYFNAALVTSWKGTHRGGRSQIMLDRGQNQLLQCCQNSYQKWEPLKKRHCLLSN